jgi:hypothetical protein
MACWQSPTCLPRARLSGDAPARDEYLPLGATRLPRLEINTAEGPEVDYDDGFAEADEDGVAGRLSPRHQMTPDAGSARRSP